MAYWLLKTEPETFSWNQQLERGPKGEPWSGVRNFQARGFLRAMKLGDLAFFFHTGGERAVVGTVRVIREAYRDHTAEDGDWSMVDVEAVETCQRPVTLTEIKQVPELAGMLLVKNPRLSVQPVDADAWNVICRMGGLKGR